MSVVRARLPGAIAALVAAGAVSLAACGGGDESSPARATADAGASASGAGSPPKGEGAGRRPVALYFTAGEQFARVERRLPQGGRRIEAATRRLLSGPPAGEGVRSQIPDGVALSGVDVDGDGRATVRLSRRFLAGVPARPGARDDAERQELAARTGQLALTLTQFADVRSVAVVAGGRPVGGELDRRNLRPPARAPSYATGEKGPRSISTRRLQRRLVELRYLPRGAVDGVAGYRTEQAVIAFQAWEGLDRDGIVGPQTTAALAQARPPRPRAGGPDRRIEVDRDLGVALLIAHDRTRRAVHVSSGAAGTSTPPGSFEVFRKELRSWSVPFQVWLPYASYFNRGIAFHEYPEVPPYPASHGCVRVPSPEARGVYRFARIGTPVVVL